ncbi:MAG: DUF4297 domain-containing protein [Verrucomicrobiae bacterium]|nr:DUF4297 domain-containing protein [Verrucomicrobiae bacterium]
MDWQKSWAFCLLLKLHRTGQDYLVLFDYHDDVVVLDSGANPTAIDFYQVKTKKGAHWTVKLLLKREKAANDEELNSIVGKMYANKVAFPTTARTLNFVSNAQFAIKHKDDPQKTINVDGFELAELCKDTLKEFSQAIQQEHNLAYSPLCDIITRFSTDPLSLDGHATHTAGEFASFLNEIRPNGKFAAVPGHRAIATAIARKTNHERSPGTKEELISLKGITRAEFEEMLATIVSHEEQGERERWDAINQALTAEGYPFGEVNRWRNAFKKYAVQRMDFSNTVLMATQRAIKSAVAAAKRANPSLTLRELISAALQRFDAMTKSAPIPFSRDYLTAIILFEASEE